MTTLPILLLDCDGVLGDLITPWFDMHNAECKVCTEPLTRDMILEWDTHKFAACGKHVYTYLARHELWSRPRPMPYARAAVEKLTRIARPVVVTAVTQPFAAARIAWVRRYFPMIAAHDIVIADKKDSVRGDVIVEDRTSTLNSHPAEGICIAHPWNADYRGTRVADWREAYDRIRQYPS